MTSTMRTSAILVLAALLLPAAAFAEEERSAIPWWFTLEAGGMFPSGQQGAGLETGSQFVGTVGYELSSTFVLGGDLGYVASTDLLRTRIVLLGAHVRMNPSADLPTVYVQGGGGLYHVSPHPRNPDPSAPPIKVRPGLTFGVGYDIASFSKLTVGVVGTYHGIVIARSDALSYLGVGAYLSLRPGAW